MRCSSVRSQRSSRPATSSRGSSIIDATSCRSSLGPRRAEIAPDGGAAAGRRATAANSSAGGGTTLSGHARVEAVPTRSIGAGSDTAPGLSVSGAVRPAMPLSCGGASGSIPRSLRRTLQRTPSGPSTRRAGMSPASTRRKRMTNGSPSRSATSSTDRYSSLIPACALPCTDGWYTDIVAKSRRSAAGSEGELFAARLSGRSPPLRTANCPSTTRSRLRAR